HRALELRREPDLRRRRLSLRFRRHSLAAPAPLLGAEVVESNAAGNRAEPGARGCASGIEPAPRAQRAFEGLGGEVFGRRGVAREDEQVAVDVVEVALG